VILPGLPTPAPTAIVIVPTPTPTLFIPTPVLPTPEPPTATSTPSVFVVSQLNAFNRNANTDVRIGPGAVYSISATLAPNAPIPLLHQQRAALDSTGLSEHQRQFIAAQRTHRRRCQ
jgi:hypothetical protein